MPDTHAGGCLCGDVRYETRGAPMRVTICHCTFCQKLTGSAFLAEPIFNRADVALSGVAPQVYEHRSDGSGKRVSLHFCGRCGRTLFLSFERFPEVLGLCAGSFDDPNWFERGPDTTRHIFVRSAQKGVALPPGVKIYREHTMQLDGTPNQALVLEHALLATELPD